MRKVEFVNSNFYHIYNRGVLKSNIFFDIGDYVRFIHCLYEFNSSKPAKNTKRSIDRNVRGLASHIWVDIICWCLMPNHFHLILKQIIDNGIRKFMHKVETGHAMYLNKKHDRTGRLFESPFKAILIKEDEYLTHLSRYIHLNPVDLIEGGWKERGINDWESTKNFLESYKWSSYLDYIGKHNFPSILNKEPMIWYFKEKEKYKKFVLSWINKDLDKIMELTLE